MSVEIKYNSLNPFSGLPVPFVERSVSYEGSNSNSIGIEEIVLSGQIPAEDNCDGFDYLISKQQDILNSFSSSFKSFEIIEDGAVVLSHQNAKVKSVSFEESNYSTLLSYLIKIEVVRNDLLSFAGVSDVTDSIDYSEGDSGIMSITHSVSATGIKDSNGEFSGTALKKAKDFVEANYGKESIDIIPVFISHKGFLDDGSPAPTPVNTGGSENENFWERAEPMLVSFSEKINRLTGTYEVVKTYVCDLYYQSEGVLRYNCDINKNPEGYFSVTLDGDISYEIDVSGDANFNKLAERFSSFNFYEEAKRASGENGLVEIPVSRSVTKNPLENKISFSISFDTNANFANAGGSEREISVSFSDDSEFITINISGEIKARLGAKNRWEVAKSSYDLFNPLDFARSEYNSYVLNVLGLSQQELDAMPINENVMSSSVKFIKTKGSVSFSFSFDNYSQTPDNEILKSFDYTIQKNIPKKSFTASPRVGGGGWGYTVQDLGSADKGVVTISGTALKRKEASFSDALTLIKAQFPKGNLANNYSCDGINTVTFTISYSYGDNFGNQYIKDNLVDLSL